MSATIKITGIDEIDKVLRGLPSQVNHQIMSNAHADSAKPLIALAKVLVRKKTGNLADSIGVKRTNLKRTGLVGLVQVGPLRGGGKKGYNAHLIEYGHRIVTRFGKTVGFSRKFPFMEPAFNSTKGQIESNIADNVGKRLLQYMKRIIKKYA